MVSVLSTMMCVGISWYDPLMTVNNHTELGFAGIQAARAWGMVYEVGRELGIRRGAGA
jgi:hypothetical protein